MQIVVDALSLGSVYAIFALGLTLAWGVMNLLNLAHGAIFVTGAYIAYRIETEIHINLILLVPMVMACTALLTLAVDLLVFRPLRNRSSNPQDAELPMLVASLGVAAVPITLIEKWTGHLPVFIPQSVLNNRVMHWGSLRVTTLQVAMFLITIAVVIVLSLFLRYTRNGRALKAISVDAATSKMLGVNSDALFATTMLISGALAGLAGVLLGVHLNVVQAQMGDPLMLKAFAVIILGGAGSVAGAVSGAYILAFAETIVISLGYGSYAQLVALAVIVLVLLVKPTGLVASRQYARS